MHSQFILFKKSQTKVKEKVESKPLPSLITAHQLIQSKLRDKSEADYDPSKQTLIQMNQILDDIFNQDHWSENISELKSTERESKSSITQSDIINVSEEIYLTALNQTQYKLNKLLELNEKFFDESIPADYLFFDFIQKSIIPVLKNIRDQSEDKSNHVNAARLFLFTLANQLNIRFIPHTQKNDPLRGNVKIDHGICHGDIVHWIEQIKMGKYSTHTVRATPYILQKQIDQSHDNKIMLNKYNYSNLIDIWKIAHSLSKKINDHEIYSISYRPLNKSAGHVIGLRKNELRDSNLGTFGFDDMYDFTLFFYIDFLEHYFKHPKYTSGTIILFTWGKIPKKSPMSIPQIKPNLVMPSHYFENVNTVLQFHIRLQTLAVLLVKRKIDVNNYKDQLLEELTKENIYLKKHFKKTITLEEKLPHEQKEKKFEPSTLNIDTIVRAIEIEKRRLGETKETERLAVLQHRIIYSPFGATLISVVNEIYKEAPITPFITNLVTNHEINPAVFIILQKQLLKKLCTLANLDWTHVMPLISSGVRLNPTKKIPRTLQSVRERFHQYVLSNENDIPGLMQDIQDIFRRKRLGYFSRWLHLRSEKVEEFDRIIKNLDCNHFYSLMKTIENLDKFEKDFQKKPSLGKRIGKFLFTALWTSGCGIGGAFAGGAIGTLVIPVPIVGTVIGALIGLCVGQMTEWIIRNKLWRSTPPPQSNLPIPKKANKPSPITHPSLRPLLAAQKPIEAPPEPPVPVQTPAPADVERISFIIPTVTAGLLP